MQERWKVKTPEHVTLNFQLAGLGSRGAAQIVDSILLGLLYSGMIALLLFTENHLNFMLEGRGWVIAFVILILFGIQWGYFFLFEWLSGGKTLGKMLLGLRVVKEDGGKATALSILIRNLLRIIDMLPFYYLIGMLMVFFHPQHKRLGDLVGGTIVIHERKKQRSKKKQTLVEKEIENRDLKSDQQVVGDWERQNVTKKDWNLLKTYVHRYPTLKPTEKNTMTREVAEILLPKLGLEDGTKSEDELATRLYAAYIDLKEEWEFQL
ncbi:RDD family protein [Halobacillus trueperi]|uniref:RDD family protein n=1 Tax=Halobacillus trueperi TaxID=156205 RepID=A0A3E0JAP1_9BACI|nr:RDD family protein [Halobacillus trueperi]REJ09950.1 RDD family protein [Halobacillus trueperi]